MEREGERREGGGIRKKERVLKRQGIKGVA